MGWIEISKQLPEKKQEILVYFKNGAGWHVTSAYWDGNDIIELCEVCGHREPFGAHGIVTHWRPMLDAPKKIVI